ncbi:hypothetical protein ES703_115422 [subsurface metagenome]
MKGVINLRGTVLPVIDTRIKIGMPPVDYTFDTCILVLDIVIDGEVVQVGALVDSVQAVLEFEDKEIQDFTCMGCKFFFSQLKRQVRFINCFCLFTHNFSLIIFFKFVI